MRTINSMKNIILSMFANIITILLGFFVQEVFVRQLGAEYLGINSLFLNVVSMLSIVELGIGSAIIYNLYEPIANKNIDKIKSLMNFYKVCYRIIAVLVLVIGILFIPFLNTIIGETSISNNEILIIYIMFLIDAVCSYLISYKRSILYANQKNYYVSIIHIICLSIMNIFQIIILLFTKNFYLFLVIKIVMRLLENIIIAMLVNKKYAYLKGECNKLDFETKKDIVKKIKALFFHKIGSFAVLGTDNILISMFFGVVTVGLYSNYKLILSAITTLIGQVFSSLNASVGNLLVYKNKKKNYEVFKRIQFLNFWLSAFTSTSIFIIMESFITIWVGKDYVLSMGVLVALCINNYWQTMRGCIATFKEAAGVFHEDRFVPLIEATVNIIFSIVFIKICGLAGVFIGTIISNFVLFLYSYPKFVYCKLFDKTYKFYLLEQFKYFFIMLGGACLSYVVSHIMIIENSFLIFVVNALICLIIPNIYYFIIFHKTEVFKYYLNLVLKMKRRFFKNEN